jgi:hypothetical protein
MQMLLPDPHWTINRIFFFWAKIKGMPYEDVAP